MAKPPHEARPVAWTWQKSCPETAFFRHRFPTLVSPWHGDRGDSKDLQRRDPSAAQEAPSRAVPPTVGSLVACRGDTSPNMSLEKECPLRSDSHVTGWRLAWAVGFDLQTLPTTQGWLQHHLVGEGEV